MPTPDQVFSSAKALPATYVKRAIRATDRLPDFYDTYDDWLADEFRHDYGGFTVYGMTKIGKTSMVERAMEEADKKPVVLEGVYLDTIDALFEQLASELKVPLNWSHQHTRGTDTQVKLAANFDPVTAEVGRGGSTNNVHSHGGVFSLRHQAITALKDSGRPLVIDDFHHCTAEVAAELGKILKPVVRETVVVLIAIPSQVFAPMRSAMDNIGRFKSIEIKPWTTEELKEIARAGFTELGYAAPAENLSTMLSREAFGSPHLMQEFCLQTSRKLVHNSISPDEAVSEAFELTRKVLQYVADENRPQTFDLIRRGKDPRGKRRNLYRLERVPKPAVDKARDNYELTLLALRELMRDLPSGENRTFTAPEIADQIRTWGIWREDKPDDRTFPTGQVTRALTGMGELADKAKGNLEPVLKTTPKSEKSGHAEIEILDPFLKCYLVHGDWLLG